MDSMQSPPFGTRAAAAGGRGKYKVDFDAGD